LREAALGIVSRDESPDRERLLLVVAGLRDANDDVVTMAIEALDDLGAKVKPVLPELRPLLKSEDAYVRGAILEALAVCGPAEADIPAIVAACDSKEIPVQFRAAKALFHCNVGDPKIIDLAFRLFDATDCSQTRAKAAKLLAHVQPMQERVVLRLAKALDEPDLPGEDEMSPEGKCSRDEDAKVACLWALRVIGPEAKAAVPHILASPLRHEWMKADEYMGALCAIEPRHPEVAKYQKGRFARFSLDADYLRVIGDDANQFSDAILKVVGGDDSFEKRRLLDKLDRVRGIPAEILLPVLLQNLDNKSGDIRGATCRVLGALGPKAAAAVPALIKELTRTNEKGSYSQDMAIEALGRIGTPAREAVAHLRRIVEDPKAYRTEYHSAWHRSVIALAQIDESSRDRLFAVLRQELQKKEECERAMRCIQEIGLAAAPFLKDLQPIARDSEHPHSVAAVQAMICIGEEAAGAEIALADLQSNDGERQVRGCEISAFLSKPNPIARVLPVLRPLHRSCDSNVAVYAAGAIRAITREDSIPWDSGIPALGRDAWR
jgi:HEAT repeat protein